ncbi:HmuY family protein [Alkaliflexus imshenetskii]|uniref:HmuY family protein n=1 Tax=Alkaliflexus imshenetskii TaxID=286730 RepID=UPI00047C2740|nr:HmuY family protein [Alkaliflexus imshenetskii]
MQYKLILLLAVISVLLFSSCEKDTPALPDNLAEFSVTQLGFESTESSKTIEINFSRAVETSTTIIIGVELEDLVYGESFTTTPEVVDGKINIPVSTGQTKAEITIRKKDDVFLNGSERIVLTIDQAGENLVKGVRSSLEVLFSSIVSNGGTMTLQGGEGGASAVNSVFVNFRSNQQTQIRRDSWDLAFWCGDDFKVILNNTAATTAKGLDKFDLSQVGASDTMNLDLSIATSNSNALNLIDDVNGNLDVTVIGSISSNVNENKVFIVNRGTGGGIAARAWKKIKIIRNENGYTLYYANINDANYQTLNIPKNNDHNFIYFSFDKGIVEVEPKKQNWDIVWTGGVLTTLSNGTQIPYYYSDLVRTNDYGLVTVSEVLVENIKWNEMSETHLQTLAFSTDRHTIGANWRVTRGNIGVALDRFYVVKDAFGNYYKLRFLNFTTDDGGTRGYPNIEYALIKKGE